MKKKCFKCGKIKDLCNFYKHKQMGDGYLGKCKECTKMDATAHRNKNLDCIRAYDRDRSKLPHRVKARSDLSKKYNKQYPLKYAAHNILSNAVRDGKIAKSYICTHCGCSSRINGHHVDYYKPLDVMWLCTICHHRQHKIEAEKFSP